MQRRAQVKMPRNQSALDVCLDEFASKKYNGHMAIKMAEQANAAIRRLGG